MDGHGRRAPRCFRLAVVSHFGSDLVQHAVWFLHLTVSYTYGRCL